MKRQLSLKFIKAQELQKRHFGPNFTIITEEKDKSQNILVQSTEGNWSVGISLIDMSSNWTPHFEMLLIGQ
jgi:hypothetical protein